MYHLLNKSSWGNGYTGLIDGVVGGGTGLGTSGGRVIGAKNENQKLTLIIMQLNNMRYLINLSRN